MLNRDQLYDRGYADGYHNASVAVDYFLEEAYIMGLEDGRADRAAGAKPEGVKSAFITDTFCKDNDPPAGYNWTGERRTPKKGEVYLTKAGNAGVAKTEAKNGRQRWILKAKVSCPGYRCYRPMECCFANGHAGRCSFELLK